MSNEAALLVIFSVWLLSGRGLNLCLLIVLYYAIFIATDITESSGIFPADDDVVFGTYALQCSIDAVFLTTAVYLSSIHRNLIRIYWSYAAIIGTSLVLNGAMMYDQMIDLSMVYQLHSFRQELSIPLDVLFAVLGSALGGQAYLSTGLHHADDSNYNRSNRNHTSIKVAEK